MQDISQLSAVRAPYSIIAKLHATPMPGVPFIAKAFWAIWRGAGSALSAGALACGVCAEIQRLVKQEFGHDAKV